VRNITANLSPGSYSLSRTTSSGGPSEAEYVDRGHRHLLHGCRTTVTRPESAWRIWPSSPPSPSLTATDPG